MGSDEEISFTDRLRRQIDPCLAEKKPKNQRRKRKGRWR